MNVQSWASQILTGSGSTSCRSHCTWVKFTVLRLCFDATLINVTPFSCLSHAYRITRTFLYFQMHTYALKSFYIEADSSCFYNGMILGIVGRLRLHDVSSEADIFVGVQQSDRELGRRVLRY